jgi:hypothetical protein
MTTVASHVLLTVREAFAVAPGLFAARIVAVQHFGADADGRPRIQPVLAARFERRRLDTVNWHGAGALDIFHDVGTDQILNVRRAANELRPIDLSKQRRLAEVVAKLDVDELVARS